jgi:response regulator RpfG family c-di-GMP phosphodiesterase
MASDKHSSKILFVDDDELVLSGITLTVGREFDVSTASSGMEGLELLEKEGPFAVIVSDFNMPQMDGSEFLREIRKKDKDVVTMLLSGGANYNEVSDAVRRGGIFRLIGKPCPTDFMVENLEQALKQYRTIRAEKDMLEQTLNGAVRAITTILAASKPLFFGLSERVKKLAFLLAEELKLSDDWRLELASTFSHLGYLTLPDEVQEKLYNHEELPDEIMDVVKVFPNFANGILKAIPRLEEITPIIDLIDQDYEESSSSDDVSAKLASLIRLAKHYERYASDGYSRADIFQKLDKTPEIYLSGALEALRKIKDYSRGEAEIEEISIDKLKSGMRLLEELRLPNGTLVASKGSVVDQHFIKIVENYVLSYFGNPFPERIKAVMR